MFAILKSNWRPKGVFSVFMLLAVLFPCKANIELTTAKNSDQNGYTITYDEAKAVIRARQIGQSNPLTVMDLTQNWFVYVEENECYFGSLENISTEFKKEKQAGNISKIIRSYFQKPKVFYAISQLTPTQVEKRLVSSLGNECDNRSIWLLSETKPKSFEDINENSGIRIKTFVGLQRGKKDIRKRRAVSDYFTEEKSLFHQSQKKPYLQRKSKLQTDDGSALRNDKKVDKFPYASNFPPKKLDPSFRNYQHDKDLVYTNPTTDYKFLANDINKWRSKDFNQQVDSEPFPDKIVKDGQVFYRHDGKRQPEVKKHPELQADGPFGYTHKQMSTDGALNSETMPRGFDFLMDHVRHVGSQRPIISAAIAGASIRGSGKESTSHVIGSAINGGYFAASANGYDDKGGMIHSHVHGTGKGVSGGASAIAPNREGEAFIQVDNSERGLSIGQSSTRNGEAFVIADVDSENEYNMQHGDSTSLYTDKYDAKEFGHTFGEAKSSISSFIKRKQTNTHKLQKETSSIIKDKNGQTKTVGMGLIEDIMEKVHQPDAVSPKPQNNDGYYKDNPITDYARKTEDENLHKSESKQSLESISDVKEIAPPKQDKGVVGLVTYPNGKVGTPPGPGELLTQAPETFLPPLIENSEDNYFDESNYNANSNNDDYYLFNDKELPIIENNQQDINAAKHDIHFTELKINRKTTDLDKNVLYTQHPDYSHGNANHRYLGSLSPFSKTNENVHNKIINNIENGKHSDTNNLFKKENINRNNNFNDEGELKEQYFPIHEYNNVDHQSHISSIEKHVLERPTSPKIYNQHDAASTLGSEILRNGNINTNYTLFDQSTLTYLPSDPLKSYQSFTTESIVYQPYNSYLDLSDPTGDASFFNTPYYSSDKQGFEHDLYETSSTSDKHSQSLDIKLTKNKNSKNSYSNTANYTPLNVQEEGSINIDTYPTHPGFDADKYDKFNIGQYEHPTTSYINNVHDTNYHKTQLNYLEAKLAPETSPTFETNIGENYGTNFFHSDIISPTVVSNIEHSTLKSKTSDTRANLVPTSKPHIFPTAYPRGSTSRISTTSENIKIISPGIIGSTQKFEPVEPGQPQLNVVTVDKNDRRKKFYQREGTPVGPGEKIPGAPGYRVPTGFRGRVVYGHSLPIEVESKKAVKGYNTRVKVSPQSPYQGPLFASVSGPEAASKFIQNPSSGIHITLNAPSKTSSPLIRRESRFHSPHEQRDKILSNYQDRNENRQNYHPSRSYTQQHAHQNERQNSQENKIPENTFKNSDGQCGYYKNECHKMYGPYQTQTLCVPIFIVVACCC